MSKQKKESSVEVKEDEGTGTEFKVFRVPKGQHRAGMWTFTINGVMSRRYSSNRQAVDDFITQLLTGKKSGSTISLPTVKGKGTSTIQMPDGKEIKREEVPEWQEGATAKERIERFVKMLDVRERENEKVAAAHRHSKNRTSKK